MTAPALAASALLCSALLARPAAAPQPLGFSESTTLGASDTVCHRCGRAYPAGEWHEVVIRGRQYEATVCAGDAYDALILLLRERGVRMDLVTRSGGAR